MSTRFCGLIGGLLLTLPLLAACDADKDGVRNRLDCQPYDSSVHPYRSETCDGIDNDCDGQIDEGFETRVYFYDTDGDGYGGTSATREACGPPLGTTVLRGDCDDTNPRVHPNAPEVCDQLDNDCNGFVNDGVPQYFPDDDGDGYPGFDGTAVQCEPAIGWALPPHDCDDARDDVFPGATERCNGRDDNCDGAFDELEECAQPAEGA